MKKIYLALLLLPMVSNVAFSAVDSYDDIDISNIDEHIENIENNYPAGFFDSKPRVSNNDIDVCVTFTMESEEELKKLLGDNGFAYYDEKTELSEKLADRTIHPYGVVNQVIYANYDFNKYMETDDPKENARTKKMTQMMTPMLIEILLTNHPEAMKCLKEKDLLKNLYEDQAEN